MGKNHGWNCQPIFGWKCLIIDNFWMRILIWINLSIPPPYLAVFQGATSGSTKGKNFTNTLVRTPDCFPAVLWLRSLLSNRFSYKLGTQAWTHVSTAFGTSKKMMSGKTQLRETRVTQKKGRTDWPADLDDFSEPGFGHCHPLVACW